MGQKGKREGEKEKRREKRWWWGIRKKETHTRDIETERQASSGATVDPLEILREKEQ